MLVFKQLPDGFIVHLWNKDIRRVRAGVDNTQRLVFLDIQTLCGCGVSWVLIAIS